MTRVELKTYDIMEEWDECEQDCLVPLYFDALDSILLKKFKDILGYFMGGVSGGSEAHLPFGNEHKVGQACDNNHVGLPYITMLRADSCCLAG